MSGGPEQIPLSSTQEVTQEVTWLTEGRVQPDGNKQHKLHNESTSLDFIPLKSGQATLLHLHGYGVISQINAPQSTG